jgi:hypothetical protein
MGELWSLQPLLSVLPQGRLSFHHAEWVMDAQADQGDAPCPPRHF